jgi:hypothetical protein
LTTTTSALAVVRVGCDKARARQWVTVPDRLYSAPHHVPVLTADAVRGLTKRRDPAHRLLDIEHFVLIQDGRTVGRIAASVPLADDEGSQGRFGFLDAPDDQAAVAALVQAAGDWVAARGAETLAGPYNYWSGQAMGLLVRGFETPPAIFQPWNPPYLPERLSELGFITKTRMSTYRWDLTKPLAVHQEVLEAGDRTAAALGLSTRGLSRRNFWSDVEVIRQLFNRSFATSPEVVPYSQEVLRALVAPTRPLIDRQLVRVLERDGQPIGFALVVPDLNQILARLEGRLTPLRLLSLPKLKRSVSDAVVLLMGVAPEEPLGPGRVLIADTLRVLRARGYTGVTTTWVHQENRVLHSLASAYLGGAVAQEYAIVERPVRR